AGDGREAARGGEDAHQDPLPDGERSQRPIALERPGDGEENASVEEREGRQGTKAHQWTSRPSCCRRFSAVDRPISVWRKGRRPSIKGGRCLAVRSSGASPSSRRATDLIHIWALKSPMYGASRAASCCEKDVG